MYILLILIYYAQFTIIIVEIIYENARGVLLDLYSTNPFIEINFLVVFLHLRYVINSELWDISEKHYVTFIHIDINRRIPEFS